MKKTFLFLYLLVTLIFLKPVSAQSTFQIYVSDVDTTKLQYNVGDKIEGEFTLSNLSDLAQSEMYYSISSGKYSEEYMAISGAYSISPNTGPIYLKAQSKENIKFSYTLPKSLSGSSAIKIVVKLKDGTLLAESVYPLDILGEVTKESVYINDPLISITGFDTKIEPLTGPTVYQGEKISLSFNSTPTLKNYTIKPILKLYNRSEKEDFLVKTIPLDEINISNKIIKTNLELPVDLDPLVYYGVISFVSDDVDINDIHVRYIIAGPLATIRNITSNTLEVKKGDVFDVSVVYSGQPIDEYRPEKQILYSSTTLTVVVTNEKGEKISEITQNLDLNNENKSVVIPMTAEVSAKGISFNASIKNIDGQVLGEYKTTLPSAKDVKNQQSYLDKDFVLIIIIALLLILLLIIFFIFNKKFKIKNKTPLAIILFGVFTSLSIISIDSVYAGISTDQQNYLNSLTENSNPVWSVIQESGADSVNFSVTSVSSPLPPATKTYEPGERFNLNFSASYGECNNALYRYTAFAYKATNVWSESPKLNGTAEERLAYWQSFGRNVLNYFVTSDLLVKYLEFDLSAIADVSVSKQASLKALINLPNISISNNCTVGTETTCFKLFSFSGMSNRTSSFSISQLIIFANEQNAQLTSARNTLLNAEGNPLGTNNELKNFNFASVGSLSSTPGHVYTTKYINMMYDLNDAIERYTDPSFTILKNSVISSGSHGTIATPFNVNVVYNAPTDPGYHALYFYLHQDGNGGKRDKTIRQVICVKGASVCPNERVNPVVKIKEVKNITQTNATVNWSFSDENGDSQADYTIKVSTQASFANESLVKTFPGNENRTDIKSLRNHQITGLEPGTVYYVKMVVKSDQPPTTSNWDQADFTFKTKDLSTYNITYNGNGNTGGTVPASQVKTQDVSIALRTNTGNLTKTGHTFAGWSTVTTSTGGTQYPAGTTYTTNAPLTLYARWTSNNVSTYNITYNGNGNTGGTAPASQVKTQDVSIILRTNTGNLTRTGYTFAGWSTTASSTGGTQYAAGITYTANAPLTLYARWTSNNVSTYNITYNGNGYRNGIIPASQVKTHGTDIRLASNTGNLTRTGYTFAGWSTTASSTGGTQYAEGEIYTNNAPLNLYARWVNTYTITYDGNTNTGGVIPAIQTKLYNVNLTLRENTGNLTKIGYTPIGWAALVSGVWVAYGFGGSYIENASRVMYTRWTPNTYNITYNGNGNIGGATPASQVKTHGTDIRLASNTGNLTKTGYIFAGWSTVVTPTGGTQYAADVIYTDNTSLNLYAIWVQNNGNNSTQTHNITYDGNENTGGTAPASQVKTQDIGIALRENTENLTKTGYIFAGWSTVATPTGGTQYAAGTTYTTNAPLTLYARWILDSVNTTPKITLTKSPLIAVPAGQTCTVTWTTENISPDTCVITGSDISPIPLGDQGSWSSGPLTENQRYTVTCSAAETTLPDISASVLCRVDSSAIEN